MADEEATRLLVREAMQRMATWVKTTDNVSPQVAMDTGILIGRIVTLEKEAEKRRNERPS